ncbi:bifunctional ATP-dependent DNA helicase/ssDNA endodeoxyribonuclease DNA2 [Aspergillus foveolatus]|uniref:bifunctional ATP-dependent DNA helicase/ssDNA endodeoxyribonuclease DNA2 n=1 Tax=Aspergillus foveolatus TaxID=210207 RepID=UPI003CCDC8AE
MSSVYKDPRPIPASADSRSKLDAFRYKNNNQNGTAMSPKKTTPHKGHTNKENQTSWLNGVVEQDKPEPDNRQSLQEGPESKAVKDCPQTPGNRLPLADLIGNAEDAFSRAPMAQEFTPEDYVIWQHAPPSSNPSTQTPATQSKKRRHSSSPSSSPLAGSKGARKGSFDLQSIQALLKTPQNDLATDLWNNYVAKTAVNVTDLQQPRFASLLSSSPRTPTSARAGQDSSGQKQHYGSERSQDIQLQLSRSRNGEKSQKGHPKILRHLQDRTCYSTHRDATESISISVGN